MRRASSVRASEQPHPFHAPPPVMTGGVDKQTQATNIKRRRNRAEIQQLVAELEASGLGRTAFCQQRGLSYRRWLAIKNGRSRRPLRAQRASIGWRWRCPARRQSLAPRGPADWQLCSEAGGGSKWVAVLMPARCSGCWQWWSEAEHVWYWAGYADLFGGGRDRHAQRFRGSLRLGARSVAVGAAEWAHFHLLERAAESAEAAVLGWQRAVGLRQTFGEGAVPLA